MLIKLLILMLLMAVVIVPALPGYCGTRSVSLTVSAFLPYHVMDTGNLNATPLTPNSLQIVQTQVVMRNNRNIVLTSIVVP